METNPTILQVVALALIGSDGRILLQKRHNGAQHGGLWEFPGGKIEIGESDFAALRREIREELGIDIHLVANSFVEVAHGAVETPGGDRPITIRLYMSRRWRGDIRCIGGEAVDWFDPDEIAALPMPPLDYPLAKALRQHLAAQPN